MKVLFRQIHLYLSLVAGIVIFGSCLTGTILVFEKEVDQALHRERFFIEPAGKRLTISELTKAVLASMPKAKLASATVYNDAARSVEVGVIISDNKPKAASGNGEKSRDEKGLAKGKKGDKAGEGKRAITTVYVNPYTAQVLGRYSRRDSFLFSVEMYHRFLLAGKDSLGDMAVGVCILMFLGILVTGVILWWPKTKAVLKKRIKIKWGRSTKRLVHDLHLVTGFYTSIFLIVICLTGIIMSFKWANNALFAVTGSTPKQAEENAGPVSAYQPGIKKLPPDMAVANVGSKIASSDHYTIRQPKDSADVYNVTVWKKGDYENVSDTYMIDQYSGKVIGKELFSERSAGQKVRSFVKPVHTGSVYGLPTKILSFFVCLLSLIFPVTGVMMWLNRTGKKRHNETGKTQIKRTMEVVA